LTSVGHHPIQTNTSEEEAMSTIGMIAIWVFVAVVFIILNYWPRNEVLERREKYWAKYESK
jgi:glucan phosphoethanolaminetransferase (alkaline phosphatase superfamily)